MEEPVPEGKKKKKRERRTGFVGEKKIRSFFIVAADSAVHGRKGKVTCQVRLKLG